MLDIIEKASSHLGEMLFVPDAQRVGNGYSPLAAKLDETDTRIGCLLRRNPLLEGSRNLGDRYDVELRPLALRRALAQLQSRAAAAIGRVVSIVTYLCFPLPAGLDGNMDTADLVLEPGIAEVFERVCVNPRARSC